MFADTIFTFMFKSFTLKSASASPGLLSITGFRWFTFTAGIRIQLIQGQNDEDPPAQMWVYANANANTAV